MRRVAGDPRLRWRAAFWLGVLAVVTAALVQVRGDIEQSHVVLTLLLVVLGGSAGGGRALGYTLAIAGFLVIDYFFQPPFGLLTVDKSLDWVVLVAFLSTAFVATELLARARREADVARGHAAEIAALSAEQARLAEEARAARYLREVNRAKDEVLATVSHDFRTPITTIKVLAQRSSGGSDSTAAAIEEQADRLSELVTNVLDLSRIRAGAVTLDIQLNTVEDLLGAAIRRAEGIRRGREVFHHLDVTAPAFIGRFDFVQSLRIVGNLIDNALRFSPADGKVELTTTAIDDRIVIRVADRGPGIADAERGRIFEPFYRPARQAPDGGRAGLGLSIARQLAELQGGSLDVEARSGGGSVFVLTLPGTMITDVSFGDDPGSYEGEGCV